MKEITFPLVEKNDDGSYKTVAMKYILEQHKEYNSRLNNAELKDLNKGGKTLKQFAEEFSNQIDRMEVKRKDQERKIKHTIESIRIT